MRLEELRAHLRELQSGCGDDEEIGRAPALDPLEEYIDCVLRVPSSTIVHVHDGTHPEISQEDARKYHG